ncbi:flavodoxin family protein [Marinisporobacter balticus]|uniref:NADPH-dependent FMN reductase n=1 Tax=Marinisporobacter balticus TaxID=2018667 RepID=A0A4R2L1D0_9FIRM|nr:NAD(P)H-dependent oxidoreductase [Marinisporobacter balticus]TCO79392.1 NADPH-dependent FMN reductase [Marinisporobacter balticus]
MSLNIIIPGKISKSLSQMVKAATNHVPTVIIKHPNSLPDLTNKKILFAVQLDPLGFNPSFFQILSALYAKGHDALSGSSAGIIVHSPNDLYTKSISKNIIFLANQLGCRFIGHPMVEATKNFNNFRAWQKIYDLSLEEICYDRCKNLVDRLMKDDPMLITNPKILALHSSSYKTSNTLMLWEMIKKHLNHCHIKELHVENGTVKDCIGCSFKTCVHYSKQSSCFYGGFMVEEILPAIEASDAIFWLCPNYNDAVSANLMAVINRLTSLYRKTPFYDKTLFSVIVSGSSGSDSVAKQLIDALNMNKGFRLPPYFAQMATANDPKTVKYISHIEEHAKSFAKNIIMEIKA